MVLFWLVCGALLMLMVWTVPKDQVTAQAAVMDSILQNTPITTNIAVVPSVPRLVDPSNKDRTTIASTMHCQDKHLSRIINK